MFGLLGKIVSRGWPYVLLAWLVVTLWLTHIAPPLDSVTTAGPGIALPDGYDSMEAAKLLDKAFGQKDYSRLVILFSGRKPLTADDEKLISEAIEDVSTVRKPDGSRERAPMVSFVLSPYALSYLKDRLTSLDNTTVICAVALNKPFADIETHAYIDGAVKYLDEFTARHPHLSYHITDSAAVGRDYEIQAGVSLDRTQLATIVLVVAILLVLYRSPLTPIVTLATVVLSLHVATCVIAIIGGKNWIEIPKLVPVYMLVIMYGSVTDYCMFIIGRFREEMARGHSRFEAVRISVAQVGEATAASAGTTIAGLLMMVFADFEIFRATGPVLGIGLAVGFLASMTFTPVFMVLFGRHLFWPTRMLTIVDIENTASGRFWGRFAQFVIKRPGLIFVVAIFLFMPFALMGGTGKPSYDIFSELPPDAPSVVGNRIILNKFPSTSRSEQIIVVLELKPRKEMPKGLPPRPAEYFSDQEGLRVVDRVSHALLQKTDDVIEVRCITRPLGREDPVFQAYINGEDSELARRWIRLTRGPAFTQYVSGDSTVTRIDIVLKHDPFSEKAVQTAKEIRYWVQPALDKAGVGDATVHVGGVSSHLADLTKITKKDIRRLRWQVLLVLYVILAIMLRGAIAPIYLLATMVLNYFATVGIIHLIFVNWLGAEGLDWKVEFFLFVLLVAIGVDYNIYIMSRLREELKRRPFRQALQHAIVFTGGIISSCGIIMAGTFASMMRSTLAVMVQIGLAMALGVMMDTFLVRPLLVPALALLVEKVKERIRGTRPSP